MTQERSPDAVRDQDFVKNIFERKKGNAAASKKISSLFGGATPAQKRSAARDLSPVGIDVGPGSISFIQLGKSNGRAEIISSASKSSRNEKGSLRQFLLENGLKGDAVIGLSVKDIQFRLLSLPPMPSSEIESAVDWATAEALGIEARRVSEFSIDYALLSEGDLSSREKKVLVAAVRKEIVLDRIKEVSDAGLNVIAVEPSPLALYAAFCGLSAADSSRLTLLLNIGYGSSDLTIGFGGDVYAVQEVSLPEETLRGALNDDGTVTSQPSVSSALENLIVDIEHSYKSVSKRFAVPGSVVLGRISISGPGAVNKGISVFLKNTFNIPAEIFDPLNAGPRLAAAVGLAMRGKREDEAV